MYNIIQGLTIKEYIITGESNYSNDFLKNIIKNEIPNLQKEKLNDDWYGFAFHIMDNLATDFNLYMFFSKTMPNLPLRFLFSQFATSVLDLCKLLDERRNNKVSLIKILNHIEQNIKDSTIQKKFLLFKADVINWLNTKNIFISNIKIIRDKFLAHIDIEDQSQNEYKKAFHSIEISEFIEVSNIVIQIYVEIIMAIKPIIITNSHYVIDEFNFIYECLRSLDKIEKNVTKKNLIIHNIDLELQEIRKLIK